MVSKSFAGSLGARAVFLMSKHSSQPTDQATYTVNTVDAIEALQDWYNKDTGLWDTTGWWNSANAFTTLADFAMLDSEGAKDLNIPDVIQNTYEQAQKTTVQAQKTLSVAGMVTSSYTRSSKRASSGKRGFENFLNDYYDDEGWWALGLIHSYDLRVLGLGDQDYLGAAKEIFEDMKNGTSPCGGGVGIYWSKVNNYTAAIANELFLSVAAALANRVDEDDKDYYLNIAKRHWNWFKNSGLINSDNLINDGLDAKTCQNNGMNTWTYNQGVILGGLVELAKATNDSSFLDAAATIASAAIAAKSQKGILYEGCEPDCGDDGAQFKGVFMRNLHYLQKAAPQDAFRNFVLANADSIWANDWADKNNTLGVTWAGPYTTATAGTQSSALDALVAAMAVA